MKIETVAATAIAMLLFAASPVTLAVAASPAQRIKQANGRDGHIERTNPKNIRWFFCTAGGNYFTHPNPNFPAFTTPILR